MLQSGSQRRSLRAIHLCQLSHPGYGHWQLGEKEQARECYEKAVRSMEQGSQAVTGDLEQLRREASRLVGIPDSDPTARKSVK